MYDDDDDDSIVTTTSYQWMKPIDVIPHNHSGVQGTGTFVYLSSTCVMVLPIVRMDMMKILDFVLQVSMREKIASNVTSSESVLTR